MSILKRLFPPANREKFARQVMARLRRGDVTGPIDFDAERFLLRYGKESQQVINLQNFYAEYVAASFSDRRKVFQRFMAAFSYSGREDDSFDQVKGQLLPRVRERFYYDSFELNMLIDRLDHPPKDPSKSKPPLEGVINRPLNDELVLELVVDLPDAIRTVTKKDLENWALNFDEAMSIAKDNLWRASNREFTRLKPGLFVSPWRDTHDASRLFLHDLIWQLAVKGDHVVAAPNRNLLFVTGSEETDNLVALAQLVDEAMQQPRPMTGQIFRLAETRWVPFVPAIESPAHWPIKRIKMKSIARDYAEQKGLLETLHQKSAQDIFVAKQMLMRGEDDRYWTWTSWTKGVTDALMPIADFVCFGEVDDKGAYQRAGLARWDRVARELGHLMEATTSYPVRYRIRDYPTDEQLATLELTQMPGN